MLNERVANNHRDMAGRAVGMDRRIQLKLLHQRLAEQQRNPPTKLCVICGTAVPHAYGTPYCSEVCWNKRHLPIGGQ